MEDAGLVVLSQVGLPVGAILGDVNAAVADLRVCVGLWQLGEFNHDLLHACGPGVAADFLSHAPLQLGGGGLEGLVDGGGQIVAVVVELHDVAERLEVGDRPRDDRLAHGQALADLQRALVGRLLVQDVGHDQQVHGVEVGGQRFVRPGAENVHVRQGRHAVHVRLDRPDEDDLQVLAASCELGE